jgi:hypothetical protein
LSVIAPEESESGRERTQARAKIRKRQVVAIERLAPKLMVFTGLPENWGKDSLPPSHTRSLFQARSCGWSARF